MRVTIRLFAALREKAGFDHVLLDLPTGATARGAAETFGAAYPDLQSLISRAGLAINRSYVPNSTALADGDELALLPPVSGG